MHKPMLSAEDVKLTMEGGLNLRKYIYVGGRLKPPEVEVPPGPYIPPVGGHSEIV